MRLLALALLALLLEGGWLALWPLAGALSHSAAFNAAFVADHPLVGRLQAQALDLAQRVLPGIGAAPLTDPLGSPDYVAAGWTLAAVFLWLAATYLVSLFLLDAGLGRHRSAVALVVVGAVVFQTTLLYLPGLFSQDVFSYIAYGRLAATYDLNPYVWPPSVIPKDAVLPWVAEVWRTYAAPYGPLWLDVQWAMIRLTGGLSIAEQALAYRVLANGLLLANLGLLWAVLARRTALSFAQRTTALAALAWNPLVLFEIGANAHNDGLMVSFSLLALLLFGRSGVLSSIGFVSGALVKYLSGVGVIWVAVAAAGRATSTRARVLGLALPVLVCTVVVLVAAWPWLELPDSLDPLFAETATVGYVNSVSDSLGLAFADAVLTPAAGLPQSLARDIVRALERLLVLAGFGAYLLWEARQVWVAGSVSSVARATARACLVYVLLVSTSVQPWYFCLPVAMAVCLGWRSSLARVTVGYSLLALPALYLNYYLREAMPLAVYLVYGFAPLLALAPRWFGARSRSNASADDGDDHKHHAARERSSILL